MGIIGIISRRVHTKDNTVRLLIIVLITLFLLDMELLANKQLEYRCETLLKLREYQLNTWKTKIETLPKYRWATGIDDLTVKAYYETHYKYEALCKNKK